MKGVNRGGGSKRAFFKAPHRSAATDRPANRSTANKSRRFLRRAARVCSCPVFGNRSDEEERPFSSRMGGRSEGADQQRAARSLKLFLAAVQFLSRRWMIPPRVSRGPSASSRNFAFGGIVQLFKYIVEAVLRETRRNERDPLVKAAGRTCRSISINLCGGDAGRLVWF